MVLEKLKTKKMIKYLLHRNRICRWTNNGSNCEKCPHIKVTVVDLNEERIAAWNDSEI